jgi:hypothetical protein
MARASPAEEQAVGRGRRDRQLLSAHHQELQRLTAKVAAPSLEALARGQVDDARSLLTKLYAKTAGDITPRPDEAVH